MRTIMRGALSTVVLLATALVLPVTASATASTPDIGGVHRVETLRYDLGDEAFQPPSSIGYEGGNELDGAVYFPADIGRGTHPLIMVEHGYWSTCADRAAWNRNQAAVVALAAAQKAGNDAEITKQQQIISETGTVLQSWPCAAGTPQIPSYLGYDYLAEQLAGLGFVVVSIGTNGINATSFGQAPTVYYARAALINKQLALWQQLAATGQGPLRGHFTDPATGKPRDVDFRGHVDLTDVGTIGHSMGGGGVMQQAADIRHGEWPAGVAVKAVFALAPTDNWNGEAVTQIPFATMWGTCDQVNTGAYFEQASGKNSAPIYKYTLTGGNHDAYNTQWSPSSGQVAAHDDALPGTKPGYCQAQFPGSTAHPDQKALTEQQQRQITLAYVSAFFLRHLDGQKQFDAFLTGQRRPPGVPDVVRTQFGAPTPG